jgi:hypothetical protein
VAFVLLKASEAHGVTVTWMTGLAALSPTRVYSLDEYVEEARSAKS